MLLPLIIYVGNLRLAIRHTIGILKMDFERIFESSFFEVIMTPSLCVVMHVFDLLLLVAKKKYLYNNKYCKIYLFCTVYLLLCKYVMYW